jgi:hypothetical protein
MSSFDEVGESSFYSLKSLPCLKIHRGVQISILTEGSTEGSIGESTEGFISL